MCSVSSLCASICSKTEIQRKNTILRNKSAIENIHSLSLNYKTNKRGFLVLL